MDRIVDIRPRTERPLRIALLAPPMEPVPPKGYGGTERIVGSLEEELTRRGHHVTTFAAGDSEVAGELVPIIDESLWATGYKGDVSNQINTGIAKAWAQHARFDIIHSHVETLGFLFARHCPTPVVTTLHGRLDISGIPQLLDEFRDIPLVAISENQRRWWPDNDWRATVHHGLRLDMMPFRAKPGDYLALVGRMSYEKGIAEAVDVAQRTGMELRVAAKMHDTIEQEYFAEVLEPYLNDKITYLGELQPAERDPLFAGALATLMLGSWPEPFGLTAIESLATGTPVICRKSGALPEIVEHGVDGFLVDDMTEAELAVSLVPRLSRERIRQRALERFSVKRMADEYEQVYRDLVAEHASRGTRTATEATPLQPAAERSRPS
jgi:glycosyltransferase involved in cell wall biosynthesis